VERSIRVLGLGNVLMGDDAFGPWVIEFLSAGWDFPEGVAVVDVGTPGLDLVPYLSGASHVVIVDTVKSDGKAGELRLYRKPEILKYPPQPRLSPHDPGVKETLLTLDFAGSGPSEVLLVGAIPGSVEMGVGLSPGLKDAVAGAAAEVLKELERLGCPATPRVHPLPASPWWEAPASPVLH
jgi:hydrogenase maturation protease